MKDIPIAELCRTEPKDGLPLSRNTKRRTLKQLRLYIFRMNSKVDNETKKGGVLK